MKAFRAGYVTYTEVPTVIVVCSNRGFGTLPNEIILRGNASAHVMFASNITVPLTATEIKYVPATG